MRYKKDDELKVMTLFLSGLSVSALLALLFGQFFLIRYGFYLVFAASLSIVVVIGWQGIYDIERKSDEIKTYFATAIVFLGISVLVILFDRL